MTLNSKNKVQGFVPCQHCGAPSPTHYPKAGNRQHTLYYNCLEHKNQSTKGVGEYCKEYQVDSLEAFEEKYGSPDECPALKLELERLGLLLTQADIEEFEPDSTEAAPTPSGNTLDQDGNLQDELSIPDNKPPKNTRSSGVVVLLIVVLLLILSSGLLITKLIKKTHSNEAKEKTNKTPSSDADSPPQKGVLL